MCSQDILHALLQKHFGPTVSFPEVIGEGLFSRAYHFTNQGNAYVLRISNFREDFKKDQWAYQHLGTHFPIPEVLQIGTFEHQNHAHAFSISTFCPGTLMDKLPVKNRRNLRPHLGEMLLRLHQASLHDFSGFGRLDTRGMGTSSSWATHLMSQDNPKMAYDWDVIFGRVFFDADLFHFCQTQMDKTLESLPNYGYLVHGDFGFNNLLIQGHQITGILDWAESKRGDFVFDWCWLDFWDEDISYSDIFIKLYAEAGMDLTHLELRRKSCFLHIGLSALVIAAHRNHARDYHYGVARLRALGTL
jgi:hygromycin-B 4-O-kinase